MNDTKRPTVLVIDDDPQLLELIRIMLEEEGYTVHLAPDGSEGIRQLEQNKPDVILTDIIMPQMEGIEFLGALRKSGELIPVVAMSGHAVGRQFLKAAHLLGARESLHKPFSRQELVDGMRRALDR